RESAAELGRTKGALENQNAEQARRESDGTAPARVEEMNAEMCRLRESEAAHQAELAEMERRVRESVAGLARATADLEKERGERRRIEQRSVALTTQLHELHEGLKHHLESERASQSRLSDLEDQLREREEALAQAQASLQKEAADHHLAEEQLRAVGDMSAQLRKHLTLFEESKKVFKRAQEQLEAQLAAQQKTLAESEARLQKEAAERARLEQALAAAQRD